MHIYIIYMIYIYIYHIYKNHIYIYIYDIYIYIYVYVYIYIHNPKVFQSHVVISLKVQFNHMVVTNMMAGWWFGTCFICPRIGKFIIPIDELVFFRGVGQPPTRLLWHQYSLLLIPEVLTVSNMELSETPRPSERKEAMNFRCTIWLCQNRY